MRKELLEVGDELHFPEIFDNITILYAMNVLGRFAVVDSTALRGGRPVWFESGCSGPGLHIQILGANRVYQASIMDVSDLLVAPANVGYGWNNSSTSGGENFCGVLDLGWSNSDNRHCESWGFDATGGLSGGHSELPNYKKQNLWALDEPDDFNRAFEIDLNKDYAGFITPQGENAPYTKPYLDLS